MEAVEPPKQACFCNRFRAAGNDIAEGLSASQAATANGHWTTWAKYFLDISLEPLLVLYRYPVPFLTLLQGSIRQEPFPQADARYNPAQFRTPHG